MPDAAGSIERLAVELAGVLGSVTNRFGDDGALDTFDELGVHFPDEFLTQPQISAARQTVFTVGAELEPLTATLVTAIEGGDDTGTLAASVALLAQCGRVVAAIPQLGDALEANATTLPGITKVEVDALVADFPAKVADLLIADVLRLSTPAAAVLEVFGVLERTFDPGDPDDPARPPFEAVSVHLDRLVPAITDPVRHLQGLYGWGGASFDAGKLLGVLESAMAALGLPVMFTPATGTTPPSLQFFAFDLTPTADGKGLKLGVVLSGNSVAAFDFPLSPPTWSAHVALTGSLPADTGGEIRPPFDITLTPPSGTLTGGATVGVTAQPPQPFMLLGEAGGSRLEFASARLDAGVTMAFDTGTGTATAGPVADGEITGGKLVVDSSGGDGFIATLLSGIHFETDFGVGFTFAPDTGLHFHGSGALEIQIPVHVELGPIEVQAVYLRAGLQDATVPVELSAGFSANLGVLQASVDRLGLLATLSFPDGGGNLGPADLAFGFKPPNGVGLAVNAAVLTGGGFLDIDTAAGEYSGALELELLDFLSIKAIGLITTRMPDGTQGFSMLMVLTAEFPGGLQLGFGFKLIGVGGIVGLNRGMRLDAIAEGVRTGAIESVMFPQDVIANAPRIISDLKAFFPPEDGIFLIGPMAKLGWGTPTLVSASVGVIIEVPGNIALLGVLQVALPAEDEAILLLQVNFAGAIEFDKQRIWFFASLYHSRVLTITIEGEMGLLIAYGDQPDFVISVGGFHPAFTPPPLPFPVPKRIAINLLNTSAARIGVDGYFAVTSNTVQFGAHAEMFFGFSALSLEGHLGFDALFQFSPFQFVIAVHADVSLKAFGVGVFTVTLDGTLSGPAPWEIKGSASISFFFFSIGVDFDISWGEARDTTLPPVDVLPLLSGELAKAESWRTRNPAGGAPLVSLRRLAEGESDFVLHPLGTLFVQQRAVPLDITVDKVGGDRAADVNRVALDIDDTGGGSGLVKVSDAQDEFALAQFQDMTDAEKLSRPAFEDEHAGVELAPDGTALASFRAVRRSARYEEIVIDSVGRQASSLATFNSTLFSHFLAGASVARSPLAQAERSLRQPFADTITVPGDSYVVASTRDNSADGPVFTSEAQAQAHLATLLAADPNSVDALHVIPAMEVAA
ncbi:MAG TPA: DUF6603 domain-containing protein [Streptosporangiaceae bacterium]|jgi:hypothetical protein